ncbi:hypothetical protein [Falsirhodobacter xinxiangensis]|uniref:hypothetical protein n=1 Tax=Falsirhodobacter xinxiangensis TaxID=2530049 RepID=UPI0010A9AC0E|nr:hypothetical protein [Rhodobacter xinxiangensis]
MPTRQTPQPAPFTYADARADAAWAMVRDRQNTGLTLDLIALSVPVSLRTLGTMNRRFAAMQEAGTEITGRWRFDRTDARSVPAGTLLED